ncbi:fungal specific transcription factor domain-containing protein [Aspergillus thermomutatus]|uniref:Xylanolytic transcriptional activator regulatory domain-containing protein n=1 Tax=Aspergillus thermomutatus TaxID=41047 RepID=A0A397GJC1_ASPTH|nr:uncharacterized protein CDV56_104361 [Aspergillus thermomutatus]RHZ50597.1 hypothetical protein CDV56_104361 [Aspergillus thermomutatus]
MKPGPKIGSLRHRKRPRESTIEEDERPIGTPRLDTEVEVDTLMLPPPMPRSDAGSPGDRREQPLLTDTHPVKMSTGAKDPDLAFILHPAHETSASDKDATSPSVSVPSSRTKGALQRACSVLKMSETVVETMINTYFENMTAISLFHQPTFRDKMAHIASPTQLIALLAAMFTFAVRFHSGAHERSQNDTHRQATLYLNQAVRAIDAALDECGDFTPPLCLLQASILAAHFQLTRGVLGRAWRMLGTCVRLAYEMNLHLVDVRCTSPATDADKWCEDEERRRAWWAVWEMDVFATTIRRTPTAVDWSQLETFLPVRDEDWFRATARPSCFLERDPIRRWKALESCGNQSAKAWFIVINSLMKEAQRISSPRGIPGQPPSDRIDEARQRLEVIANAVRCFQLALPRAFRYDQRYLAFDFANRQMHSAVYNIHMMTQLARIMIYRYDVFKGRFRVAVGSHEPDPIGEDTNVNAGERLAGQAYFDAAGDIQALVHHSSDDHIRHINPFLSNTIWLASAVHLMRSQLCRPGMTRSVIKSRYEVLHLTYKKCVRFWDMHTAVQQNLEALEEQLEEWQAKGQPCNDGAKQAQSSTIAGAPDVLPQRDLRTPSASLAPPTPPPSHRFYAIDWQTEGLAEATDPSSLDAMAAQLLDPMFLFGTASSQGLLIDNNSGLDLDLGFWGSEST